MDDNHIPEFLAIWIAVVVLVAIVRGRRGAQGAGLVLGYLLNLWLIHWPAAALYVLPWYQNEDPRVIEAGLEQSVYAVAAFALASLFLTPLLEKVGIRALDAVRQVPDRTLPKAYVAFGFVCVLLMSTFVAKVPSLISILASGQQLITIGLGLCCWDALRLHESKKVWMWLVAVFALPFLTLVTGGFMAHGVAATITVLVFLSSLARSQVKIAVIGIVLGYLGLSVYVTYMRDRGEIRASVWGGESLSNRVDTISQTFTNFEWFDIHDRDHLMRVDGRLNQCVLEGAAVRRLSETGEYAHGDTLWEATLALIPRAFWPDKPMAAGSSDLVSRFTGIQFAAGTSVGIGQVMEFYVNFGTAGTVAGFLLFGVVLTILDSAAANCLRNGDLHGFVMWFLPGIGLLEVGGSLVEITVNIAASMVVAFLANKYLARHQRHELAHQLGDSPDLSYSAPRLN